MRFTRCIPGTWFLVPGIFVRAGGGKSNQPPTRDLVTTTAVYQFVRTTYRIVSCTYSYTACSSQKNLKN